MNKKTKGTLMLIGLILVAAFGLNPQEKEFPKLSGPKIGQESPRLFIMGGFSEKETYSAVYSISLPDFANGKKDICNRGPSLPKALQGHTAVAIHNRIFVLGGLEGFNENRRAVYSPDVFSAEIQGGQMGKWKREKPLPHPLAYHAAVCWKDFIIVSGGQSPADASAVYVTTVTKSGEIGDWEKAGDLPKAMRGHAVAMVNDRMHIFGGHDNHGFFSDAYSASVTADGKIGGWEPATPLPLPLVHSGIAAHKERVYIVGGQDTEDYLHAEIYSAEVAGAKLGSWRKEMPFPAPQSRMTVHVVDGQVIVTGGGFGWAPPVYSAIFASRIGAGGRLGKWRKLGDLPRPLAFHAAVVCPEKQR